MTFNHTTMQFHELTDKEWESINPHILPRPPTGSRPRADDRITINGIILYVLMSGYRWWMDMSATYGSYKTDCLGASQKVERKRRYLESNYGWIR